MLLEFKIKNYKSFKDEAILSLVPAPKQKDLEYSVLSKTIQNKEYKALATTVIYGPNAAGKSNIIGAIETLINLINTGNIRNKEKGRPANVAASFLEYIPHKDLKEKAPVEFSITFIVDDKHITYTLSFDLGRFFETNATRKVLTEQLVVNSKVEFNRDYNKLTFGTDKGEKSKITELLENNLNDEELFLTNGYKNLINNVLINEMTNYLNNNLKVIYRADTLNVQAKINDTNKNAIIDTELSKIATEIGAFDSKIGFVAKDHENVGDLSVFLPLSDVHPPLSIPINHFESLGTIRFLNLYPLIKQTLRNGGVLIIDEFDASIHPMVLLDIVNIFHNDEINKAKAQLIFNTHNPIFLNSAMLRRDEIKFVEKNENGSTIYALSDFKTSGTGGVRKTDDYMKHYFINKYGAILNVELSEYFANEKKKIH